MILSAVVMQDASPDPVPPCPHCAATHVVRNGDIRSGVANFLCRGCGRQFVARPKKGPTPEATRQLGRRRRRERMAPRAIARSVGVSRSWLQGFVNALYRDEAAWGPGPR